ncbi:MAG: hypothetical protein ACI8ZM_003230 [Crocinitomix sp.]|jgi:hypothetical protein
MKKIVAMVALTAFLGGMSFSSIAQDGEKKNNTTKTEKKKCDKKKCCEKKCDKDKKKKG